jgi:hypothetical protein
MPSTLIGEKLGKKRERAAEGDDVTSGKVKDRKC